MTSRNNAGFTLLEMLVVIAIMGLVFALVAGFGPPRSHWLQTQTAAQQIAEAMRDARGKAIADGQPEPVVLPHLPPWITVTVQAPPGGIVFAPDGSATGGSVVLDASGREIAITADWLTGAVQINAN